MSYLQILQCSIYHYQQFLTQETYIKRHIGKGQDEHVRKVKIAKKDLQSAEY
jgi:hypothetical protein